MIIGLTGKNGAGKGVVADLLRERGFASYSLSDMIRDEIRSRGGAVTRERLITTGREMREQGGPGVLAERVLKLLSPGTSVIVDSMRHPAEVAVLRTLSEFKLLCVDADAKTRFERCVVRSREGDPKTFAEFQELEQREFAGSGSAQQLLATAALADAVVMNDGSMTDVEQELEEILKKWNAV